jgi:hypothetical protein
VTEGENSDRPRSAWAQSLDALRRLHWRRVFGEFALIVVGVLVALAVNNWNGARERDRTETFTLQAIRGALAADLTILEDADSGYRVRERLIADLLVHLKARRGYTDSLRANFGAIYGYLTLQLNRAPYEALKARDIGLVTDDSLRTAIVDMYERVYPNLMDAQAIERNAVLEAFRPYFLREFYDLRFRVSATPWNYDALLRDRFFMNLVEYRLAVIRANPIDATAKAISQIQALVLRLDHVLGNRR